MKWKKVKLGEITKNLDARRKPLNEQQRSLISEKLLYPYIGANNIMGYVDEFLFDEEILCIAEDGGSWGKNEKCATIYRRKTWVNNHAHVLSPNDGTDLRYLMNYLNWEDLNKFITGTTRGKLTKSALEKIEIPLPPFPIQKQIADKLDKADALRQKDQQLLQKYDELAQSIFYEMFGDLERNERRWQESKLETVCADIVDCPHSTPKHSERVTQFPCIRTSELIEGEINWSSMKYVDVGEYLFRTKRLVPRPGDIVYGREGTFGEAIIIPSGYKMCLGQRTMLFRPNNELVNSTFLWYQLRSDFVYKQALRKNTGSTVGHVNVADIKKFRILVPPLELQQQFDENMMKALRSRQLLQSSSNNSDQLFNGLLQHYFS